MNKQKEVLRDLKCPLTLLYTLATETLCLGLELLQQLGAGIRRPADHTHPPSQPGADLVQPPSLKFNCSCTCRNTYLLWVQRKQEERSNIPELLQGQYSSFVSVTNWLRKRFQRGICEIISPSPPRNWVFPSFLLLPQQHPPILKGPNQTVKGTWG